MVITLGALLTLTFGTRLEHQTIISLAQQKVRHDLSSAWMVYNEKLNRIKDIIQLNSNRESIVSSVKLNEREILLQYLGRIQGLFQLDFLSVTDQKGQVLIRTSSPETWGDDLSHDIMIKQALEGKTTEGTQILPRKDLIKEGYHLAEKALIEIIPTPKTVPLGRNSLENGMVIKTAAPIRDEQNRIIGTIYGGILLNRNNEIVDRVKEIVFKDEKYKGKEIGTATIFQENIRISTNVETKEGTRAVGTLVSQEVNQAVLQQGNPWTHRAFVVNDWYISAYEPIKDIENNIIGILYVGMLEKPYIDLRNKVMVTFTGIAFLCVVLLLAMMSFTTSTIIIHPLNKMIHATQEIAQGDLSHKVEIDLQDEVGQLAQSFNQMTENLRKANEKLLQWGRTLEKRVEERTRELQETQDSLIQSEKLASLGKMAAGVAHEINNPLTSILINTHLMLEKTDKNHAFFESLDLIAEETSRCSQIVKGLLEFSRQNPPQKEYADVNDILTQTIDLVQNQVSFHNIKVIKKFSMQIPLIKLDRDKIKQVFLNLMMNASDAMPKGGTLTIQTDLTKDKKFVEISFIDTGIGIPKENIHKLFDPFFTTKSSGTGLGLAVSYGIIKQHQGNIDIESEPGKGSAFIISFPIEDRNTQRRLI
ncbi:MAG: cache domain-containing protein [Candidatus Aminicenantes bacterium]|nr:cache domain-containing protein [Candidatus Aminicenantes bacterium]